MSATLIDNPWFYAAAIPAVLLNGVSKGGFGGGMGGFSVPLMALTIAPTQAAAIMLPILMVMDALGLYAYWGKWDKRVMRVILPAGLVGVVLGWLTFKFLADYWLRILLGVISIGFVLYNVLPRAPQLARPSDAKGRFWAALSGLTSFIAHAGGPPLNVYVLPQRLETAAFAATLLVFFAFINAAKVLPYLLLGLFDATNVATSAALAPAGALGIWLGIWLRKRISRTVFFRIVYVAMFATGCKLLYDGLRGALA
ncbi:MAG: sulfite exporter TauE/SafE family protein [Burkholderiales bacterium]|nr:sulfite exporter TauE/SafE family protein [Burkholderiales bacterium]